MSVTSNLRHWARTLGVDIRPVRRFDTDVKVLAHFLQTRNVDLVFDVGANEGQFARSLYRAGYRGAVVSFEPLLFARERLIKAAAQNPNWTVAPPLALGSNPGNAILHVAGNSISSSLLDMQELHIQAASKSAEVSRQSVEVQRLDHVVENVLNFTRRPFFLKLDTQGTEKSILDGATKVLESIQGIKIELTFVPLYDHQPLFEEVYSYIQALGFELWDIVPGFRHGDTGRLLQCDAVFLKANT